MITYILKCKEDETLEMCHERIKKKEECLNRMKSVALQCEIDQDDFVLGDFDKDGIPNIDDKHPFTKIDNDWVSSISLAEDIQSIKEYGKELQKIVDKVKKDIDEYSPKSRIKDPYSTIHKLKDKYLKQIDDVAGMRINVMDYEDAKRVVKTMSEKYPTKEGFFDDYFTNPKAGYYRAFHITPIIDGKPVELQIRTIRGDILSNYSHKMYKEGTATPDDKKNLIAISNWVYDLDKGIDREAPKLPYKYIGIINKIKTV